MKHFFATSKDWDDCYVLETYWDIQEANKVNPQSWSWKPGDIVKFSKEWVNAHSY